MGFLRRILGGRADGAADPAAQGSEGSTEALTEGSTSDEDEAERERRLLHEEADRLDHDLVQRQLRWADRAWTPPAQGGTRRAEDGDRSDSAG